MDTTTMIRRRWIPPRRDETATTTTARRRRRRDVHISGWIKGLGRDEEAHTRAGEYVMKNEPQFCRGSFSSFLLLPPH